MKTILFFALICGPAYATEVTPVQKVIQLMNGMLVKGKEEKHAEQVQFAAYKQFCDDTSVDKKREIDELSDHIEMLKADIEKLTVDAEKLGKEIADHDEDIFIWKGDQKAATNVRKQEKDDYRKMHKDYVDSIDALERAIAVLKKQAHDRPQAGEALIQVKALTDLSLIPTEAKNTIEQFIQQDQSGMDVMAPEASGYEFQSSGVIEMLEKLHDKFTGELTQLEKEEKIARHEYDMLMTDLDAQIEQATRMREQKAEIKAKKLQKKADDEDDLKEDTKAKEQTEKYLAELTATCEQKSSDFTARQQLRTEEIEAIEKAIEIIESQAVSGAAEQHLPGLVQTSALAQLRADLSAQTAQNKVVSFLKKRAAQLNSRILSTLAVRAASDPFTKVKKMIKDLIVRLMEEANDEAEHKGWCDKELSTNEQTRKEKTDAVESLHAEIDELEATIAKLTESIEELTKEIAELTAAMKKATEMRQKEKAENTATIKDAVAAEAAVQQALEVLKEFYAKAGDATALLQEEPAEPEIFDKPYKGMQASAGGVVGMLEVIESDFARLASETKASEATAQKEYDEFMSESKEAKDAKSTEIEHKTVKKQDAEQALTVNQNDLEGTQKELEAALAYFDKLKPTCIDSGVSYEERVARRKEEIESLQEALKILSGEDIAAEAPAEVPAALE